MSKYTIEITETLQKQITVEAPSKLEAYITAKLMYRNSEVVLDANDHVDTKFEVYEPIKTKSKKGIER